MGIDTIVVVGAWTDDCVLSTVVDATDRYGLDVVLVTDAVATSTVEQGAALEVMCGTYSLCISSSQLVSELGFLIKGQGAASLGSAAHRHMTEFSSLTAASLSSTSNVERSWWHTTVEIWLFVVAAATTMAFVLVVSKSFKVDDEYDVMHAAPRSAGSSYVMVDAMP